MDIAAEDDFVGLCDQKKFISTCVRCWTITELRLEGKDYWNKWNKIINKH